ncbi:uncharacterized protein LAJ45_11379 [Morchella importuna]|uniref:MICOS complex subunit n=1 Tax=Morchella conica CCBAS932 TaxID=1392247 RepID=A0A3N4KCU4_9PEZI|nr:uncharacterized protein LAJ45_11379 [Morchella importuna]KAH8144611.1 hypothetical protein LAJ45_11379 [Morchella importuna]RPB08344.1 hypothetical protein P167DRAFT_560557 [Morchella conica CCBAS932]
MSFRLLTTSRPAAFAGAALTTAFFTTSTVYADEAITRPVKKSLYDPPAPEPSVSTPESHTRTPTPTDRLAVHIGTARRFVTAHAALAQREIDSAFSKYLSVESTVTSTIASLAPPRSSEEKVVPGLLYVAVSTMAGSILVRRRMLPIRVVTPLVVAVGAGWYFMPETSRNVGDLVWEWEKKVPQVAETHLAVREGVEKSIRESARVLVESRKAVDGVVTDARRTVEGWVKKSGGDN